MESVKAEKRHGREHRFRLCVEGGQSHERRAHVNASAEQYSGCVCTAIP